MFLVGFCHVLLKGVVAPCVELTPQSALEGKIHPATEYEGSLLLTLRT